MEKTSLAYAAYWRICLSDAELGKGSFSNKDTEAFTYRPRMEFDNGRVAEELVAEFFMQEPDDTEVVEVTIRPYVYCGRIEHGKFLANGTPEVVTPIVSQAFMDRKGKIYPNPKTFVPRDILEPLDRGSFSIGTVTDLDKWLSDHEVPEFDRHAIGEQDPDEWHKGRWQAYQNHCREMLGAVADGWPSKTDPFDATERWMIVKNKGVNGASQHILALYDHMRKNSPSAPLFDRYASEEVKEPEPCLPTNSGFSLRLGHASDTYPLTDAQRDAMTHQLVSRHGEIVGVNGPPGTGKTTLVLSVVASHWVQAALDGNEPPVIAAASTNNQAVTNIIDAFAKDFSKGTGTFAGRWLPDVNSFGAYFPSASKEKEAAEKYQTKAFFDLIEESSYVGHAKDAYLKAASVAFPELNKPSLQQVVEKLKTVIWLESEKLVAIEDSWNDLQVTKNNLVTELGDTPEEKLSIRQKAVNDIEGRLSTFQTLQDQWESFLAHESWIYLLFSWISPIARKRLLLAKEFLKQCWPGKFPSKHCVSVEDFSAEIEHLKNSFNLALKQHCEALQRAQRLMKEYKKAMGLWSKAIESVTQGRPPETLSLADCDRTADTTIRFQAFLYATHYWEGRWLMEMEGLLPYISDEKKKNGTATIEKRWRRRMKLTPCVVSTFFMLPKGMLTSRYNNGSYVPDYLYDFIDLLIVDEAGQVLPEVAGASFSLAKRAMVIGDTRQIEPIWSVKVHVDIGNLISVGVMDDRNIQKDYERIADLGKAAASGSVMEIAQAASRYHYDPDMARGMFLYEHRRCYDEIVGYCNALCYHDKLIPMRGSGLNQGAIPAMGYLHINGLCQRSGGSRQNLLEAETIAAWIVHHKDELVKRYGKEIDEIVGVVTPFAGQVAAISEACQALGLKVGKNSGEMTVGTVHSLQGAERAVVIFSPTYSKHADGPFMDSSPSMLNVAVSRAKDSFLVFGDMDIFNPMDKGRPRGLLASFLFADQGNSLSFTALPRKDICPQGNGFEHLLNAPQHDEFLLDALAKASREVHIVSPWIRQQQMEDAGILAAMAGAVARGVFVTVYADQYLNHEQENKSDIDSCNHWLAALESFSNKGIELIDVPQLHSKIVVRDNDLLCVGSFNWLSAARSGPYARHETSIVYAGPQVGAEVKVILQGFSQRAVAT